MKAHIKSIALAAAMVTLALAHSKAAEPEGYLPDSMTTHPEWYINITDWSVYATWSAVAIIHHVTIENTSDIPYKDVRVRVTYTSSAASGAGSVISQETGVLPVTLPPRSKDTYLRSGTTLGAGSQFMNPLRIEVLGAVPVLD